MPATRVQGCDPSRILAATLRLLVLVAVLTLPAHAQEEAARNAAPDAPDSGGRLPDAVTTGHELALGDRTLVFDATAGALTLSDPDGRAEAEFAFVAYTREAPDARQRPVTFLVNGGPGAASAYLHIGAVGPWILPMGDPIVPSQPVEMVPNAETWLDVTDLVFVDPVGTGFSRLIDDGRRDRYLSIDGDADALARFILQWLTENGRLAAPTYFAGESYGGFRGPLVAEALQTEFGVGLSGLILVSPVLDFGWWQQPDTNPLPTVALLPSLAAAGLEARGAFAPVALQEAEAYASGAFVTDLLLGPQDTAAQARIVSRVAELTGLPPALVERYGGRLDREGFVREIFRDEGRIASGYDAAAAGDDPAPGLPFSRAADPVLDAMTAPLTRAMLAHYSGTLGWAPERRYILLNGGVSRAWDWGGGWGQPEAVGPLRRILALDPRLRVLVVHGATDLVTPYFASTLILRQMRGFGPGERVRQATYRGGHMFYTDPASRRAFREDALALYADDRS